MLMPIRINNALKSRYFIAQKYSPYLHCNMMGIKVWYDIHQPPEFG